MVFKKIMSKKRIDKQIIRELEIQLIIEVKRNECLYAKNTDSYRNKHIRHEAWRNIAKRLGVTVEESQRKWNSLRDSFRAYYRAKKKSPGGKFTVKWMHYKSLQFLMPHIRRFDKPRDTGHVGKGLHHLHSDYETENNNSSQNCTQTMDSSSHMGEVLINKEEIIAEHDSHGYDSTTTPAMIYSFEQPQFEPEAIDPSGFEDKSVPASMQTPSDVTQRIQEAILMELKESNRYKKQLLNLEKEKLEEQKLQNFETNKQAYINIELKRKELELYALKIKSSCSNCQSVKIEVESE